MKKTNIIKYTNDGSIHRLVIEEGKSCFTSCGRCSLLDVCNSGSKLLCHTSDVGTLCRGVFIEENKVRHITNVKIEVEGVEHRLVLMEGGSSCSDCSLKEVCSSEGSICLDYVDAAIMPYARFLKIT